MDVLKDMGIQMVTCWNRMNLKFPEAWKRVAKISSNICHLKDKGFASTETHHVHMNRVKPSPVMRHIKIKQHHQSELKRKADLCRLRHTCEVVFSRVHDVHFF